MISAFNLCAQTTFSLYVGGRALLTAPNPPNGGALFQTAWAVQGTHISLEKSTLSAYVKVNEYFNGTEQVQCDYYWYWYDNYGSQHTNHATTYYDIKCLPVNLELSDSHIDLEPNGGKQLTYKLTPSNVYPAPVITFYSSDTQICTVTENGYVRAISPGSATINVRNSAGPDAQCSVSVLSLDPTGVSLPSTLSIEIEEASTLSAMIYPSGAWSTLSWWSDNASVASVDQTGCVTGIGVGKTKVWVKTNKGGFQDYCDVNVDEPVFSVENIIPSNNSYIHINTCVKIIFSHKIEKSRNFNDARLLNCSNGKDVDVNATIDGKVLTFTPTVSLDYDSKYEFVLPEHSVVTNWGAINENEVRIKFYTIVAPDNIKYFTIWSKTGKTVSISLEEKPSLHYNFDTDRILCRTSKQEISFTVNDAYKYTLETKTNPSRIPQLITTKTKPDLLYQKGEIRVCNCPPQTELAVYNLKGHLVGSYKTDEHGDLVVSTLDFPSGCYFIRICELSIKIIKF